MLISYIQSIMMIILEVICCKIFFESFAEKRSKNNYRNYSIILGIVVCEYVIASLFYDKFILKQILAIVAVAVFMCFYFKIHFGKAIILSLLFQALLLSVDYFTLWLNVLRNASYVEMSALEAYYDVDRGNSLSSFPQETGHMGLNERCDLISSFEKVIQDMNKLGKYDLQMFYMRNMNTYLNLERQKKA